MNRPTRIIAVAGGSGSGKTTYAHWLQERLGRNVAHILSQDSYYIDQSARFDGDGGSVNFDHPEALDFSLLEKHLVQLRLGQKVEVPIYHFPTHTRSADTEPLQPAPIIILDGTLILSQESLRPHFFSSVFIDVEEQVRFERRLRRDVHERGRKPDGVYKQFFGQVKPMHDLFVQPSRVHARWVVATSSQIEESLTALVDGLLHSKS